MENYKFKIGDNVRLKNDKNSPNMTVENVEKHPKTDKGYLYNCVWFYPQTHAYKREVFIEGVLDKAQ